MASEPVEYQVLVLRVSIHCQGCKKKVKKVLQHVDGVYGCDIDARSNRVAVTASKSLDAGVLIARLRKSGKLAEPWPEEPKQQQEPPPPPAESQSHETKNQADGASKPNEAAEKPAPEAAAEPSNAQPPTPAPAPEKTTDETPPPAPAQESKEAGETKAETGPQPQPNEANGTAPPPQQQHEHYAKPMDAKVTMEFGDARGRSIYGYGGQHQYMPDTRQPPVHVMSYNVARPMASASYYAAAPTPAAMPMPMPTPMPMARPGPSQGGYIDEYAPPPSYYSRPAPPAYEAPNYYYHDPQPSPYRHQRSAEEDYYYGYGEPPAPQRSAFSPPREAYGDMFNDENANSCSVM